MNPIGQDKYCTEIQLDINIEVNYGNVHALLQTASFYPLTYRINPS